MSRNHAHDGEIYHCDVCNRDRPYKNMHAKNKCVACYKRAYYHDPVYGPERRAYRSQMAPKYRKPTYLTIVEIDE